MMQPSRHTTYHEVVDALERGGCPVCDLAERSVRHQLESLSYEQVNDPGVREELRAARGFCRRHAWQFLRMGGTVFGAAIIYNDVLRTVRRELPSWSAGRRGDDGLLGGLLGSGRRGRNPESAKCPTCRTEAGAEARYLETIVEHATDPAFRARYEATDGLCIPHLLDALDRADDDVSGFLKQAIERKLGPLLQDLGEFIRKHDYRFRKEGWQGREAEAPGRAVRLAAGEPFSGPGGSSERRSGRPAEASETTDEERGASPC
jgi:hypothetical protein